MAEKKIKTIRLSKAAREFNVGISTIVDFLNTKGIEIDSSPNTKLTPDYHEILLTEFQSEKTVKEESKRLGREFKSRDSVEEEEIEEVVEEVEPEKFQKELLIKDTAPVVTPEKEVKSTVKVVGKIDISEKKPKKAKKEEAVEEEKKEEVEIEIEAVEQVKPEPKLEEKKVEEKKVEEKVEPAEKETVEEKQEAPAEKVEDTSEKSNDDEIKVIGKIDLSSMNTKTKPARKSKAEKDEERKKKKEGKKIKGKEKDESVAEEVGTKDIEVVAEDTKEKDSSNDIIKAEVKKLEGPTILGKIELPKKKKESPKSPVASSKDEKPRKKKRKRIKKEVKAIPEDQKTKGRKHKGKKKELKVVATEEDINKKIKETLAQLEGGSSKSKSSKHRKLKRQAIQESIQKDIESTEEEKKVLKVTEFVTANELANMMSVSINDIISACMSLGLFVSINQRLDAETLTIVAEEFGFQVEFVSVDFQESVEEDEDEKEEDIMERAPIITIMGHVDHGKTSLLDYIRNTNVIAGEAGGITQHIGAYEIIRENDKRITFLDTPGHEAFTAMRARGAKITDIVIIVIAADDSLMPQTHEAINHAQAAGVPIIIAINKIDKPNANPEKIKEELANINILVEDWGGKYQCQEISAKNGQNVDLLMEKILLEAEMLDLKGNPSKNASGTVLESSLDKGKGYVAKILVQNGTMKTGDFVLAGCCFGKVKAMYNERNAVIENALPSSPALLLGLNGAPQAGDTFKVMNNETEAKSIATKRLQLQREQGIRTQKHITLDEIGRRIAVGDFKELNIIIKGDVDGSVEALSDSIHKLSIESVQVNIIHKSVGQISESDILLASASDAIVIGFQVRPSIGARKLAEKEQIDIRLYSVIYKAIEELQAAVEGMLAPEFKEEITCNVEVRDVFKITKVGTIAGCMVVDGKITRNTNVRLIRDGIVIYTGELVSLKRFKDDAKEVKSGYECGLGIQNFNDIKVGDIVEGFEEIEIIRTPK